MCEVRLTPDKVKCRKTRETKSWSGKADDVQKSASGTQCANERRAMSKKWEHETFLLSPLSYDHACRGGPAPFSGGKTLDRA